MLVADCVPVLLADPEAGVVAAVHAGRRGLVAGVVEAAVAAMVAQGASVERVRAAIGPAIAGESYEVPAELQDEVASVVPQTRATTSWGTPALDLPAGVAAVLAAAGVEHVTHAGARHLDGPGAVLVPALAAHGPVRRASSGRRDEQSEVNGEVVGRVARRAERGRC